MTTKSKPRPYGDKEPPAQVKKPVNLRLTPDMIERLKTASAKFEMPLTRYIEVAIRNQFAKDGIQ
jgi:hypothetical protein